MNLNGKTKILLITAVLYSLWVVFYIICYFLKLSFFQPRIAVSIGFIAVCLISAILAAGEIEEQRYTAITLLSFFIISGRLVGFTGAFAFSELTGKTLFRLPFGSIDYFIFYLLSMGLFHHVRAVHDKPAPRSFSVLQLLPALLLVAPVLIHLYPEGITFLAVYSLVFTGIGAAAAFSAVSFWKAYPGEKRIALAIIIALLADMLIYLYPADIVALPAMLNYLLLPYAILLFVYGLGEKKKGAGK